MPYTITLNNDSPQALAFVEFAKNFDFLKVTNLSFASCSKLLQIRDLN